MGKYKPKSHSLEPTASEGSKGFMSRKIDGLRKAGLHADISKPQQKKRTLSSPEDSPCHRPAIPATTGCKHVNSPSPKYKLKDI